MNMQAPNTRRFLFGALMLSLCAGLSCVAHAQAGGIDVRLGASGGFGHRDVRLPTRAGLRTLDSAVFPALAVVLDGGGLVSKHLLLGVRLHYQSSVLLQASEKPAAGSGSVSRLRSHHVEAGITPGLQLGSVQLRLFAGWAWRGLRAVRDIALPQYQLDGPVLRPELRLPFASGSAEIRLAPELLIVSGMSSDLRALSNSAATGLAWGAELELSVRLSEALRVRIDYRESHASISSAWTAELTDVERFATAGLDVCF